MTCRAVSACRCAVLSAYLLTGLAAWPLLAGPLPRLVVSAPPSASAGDVVRTITVSGMRDAVIVLPPVKARIGAEGSVIESGLPVGLPGEPATRPDFYLHLVVRIGDVPGTGRDREAFVEARVSEIVNAASLDVLPLKGLIVEVASAGASPELFQFTVATLVVKTRGARPGLPVSLALPDDVLQGPPDLVKRLVAYADAVVVRGPELAGARDQRLGSLFGGRPVILRVDGASPPGAARAFLASLIDTGTPAAEFMWVDPPTAAALRELCTSYQFLARTLGSGFEMTGPELAPVAVQINGQPATHALAFVGRGTAEVAVLLRSGGSPAEPRPLAVAAGSADTLQVLCYDPLDGRALSAPGVGSQGPGCASDAEFSFVRIVRGGGAERLFEDVTVRGRAGLSVEEIIARWQAGREAERRALDNYSVQCFLTLHFEIPSFDVDFDVSLELQRFVERSGTDDWVQTGLRVNGVRFRQSQEFPLPVLEPEKVVTQPLELALDEKYVYRLLGTETVNGVLSYVVAIEPAGPRAHLYAGRVWIDGVKFKQVRMQLEQRMAQHNISTHSETQDFRTVRDAEGREYTVFERIFVEEAISVGGRPSTVEKTYRFGDYAVNAADFSTRLQAARASDSPMFRDTPEGLRSLRRQDGARVVTPAPSKRIESWLGGTVYDGSYDYPVPLFGVSLVDFDFRGKGEQLSVFCAGLLLAGNLSKQRGPSLRTSVEVSLSALSTLDQLFVGDVAQKDSQYRSFEQSAGALVSWQPSASWTLTASTHVAVQSFHRTNETSPSFITPSTGLVLRAWGEAKYTRHKLDASFLVEPSVRVAGFGSYGWVGAAQTPGRTYVKYQAEVSKHVYVGKLTRGGVTASYYGGLDLDRLSLYRTSFLTKPAIVGVPAGVESFDAIGIAGAYYGFNVMDLAKLTGSYNHAWGRNVLESSQFRQYDGLNLDIGTPGPLGTFVQGSVGFTLNGNLGRYNSRWSAMVVIFKPMRR